jgi:hypothetical protein
MIVDNAQKATAILMQHNYLLTMTPVLVVSVPDQPGGIAPVLATLAEGSIDIEYMYSLFTHTDGQAYMVFRISDEEKFAAKLLEHGMHPVTKEELGLLPYAALVITSEDGIRFLMDHIGGDTYYNIYYPGQNLDRARTQLKLVEDMERKLPEIIRILKKIYSELNLEADFVEIPNL